MIDPSCCEWVVEQKLVRWVSHTEDFSSLLFKCYDRNGPLHPIANRLLIAFPSKIRLISYRPFSMHFHCMHTPRYLSELINTSLWGRKGTTIRTLRDLSQWNHSKSSNITTIESITIPKPNHLPSNPLSNVYLMRVVILCEWVDLSNPYIMWTCRFQILLILFPPYWKIKLDPTKYVTITRRTFKYFLCT